VASVLAREIAAALPQSSRQRATDARAPVRAYARSVFARVLIALDSRADSRDALVLAAQLPRADGELVVAHILDTEATPLAGGTRAAASRRDRLRDRGEEVYATLGPDPRVRYLPVSGLPLADALITLARRERAEVLVIGQDLVGRDPEARRLVAGAPCPVAVAPYGHRFAGAFAPARIAVACAATDLAPHAVRLAEGLARGVGADLRLLAVGDGEADAWLDRAKSIAPAAETVRVQGRIGPELVAQTHADIDLIVIGGVVWELLRGAACPVLVLADAAAIAPAVAAPARR
jgi:nucleotide-binding universal stress UspA family protein